MTVFLEKYRNSILMGALVVVMAMFALIFFYRIEQAPLLDYDEAIYAQVARESLVDDGLGFDWKGNLGLGRESLWVEKPPLMLWLIQAGFWGFGINELGARVWVALFALGTILLTYFVTKKLFSSSTAGILATATYFICFQYIENASILQFDIPVGFFILLSFYLFYLALERRKYFYWFGVSLALGVLTKNVIGFLPGVIALLFSVFTWNFSYFKYKEFWKGVGLFFLIVIPWHLVESLTFGRDFWNQYLFYHVLGRWQDPLEGNTGTFWYYWNILIKGRNLFWLSMGGLGLALIQALRKQKNYLYVLIAVLVIFIFFGSSNTKLPAYILVIYPFLTILAGALLAKLLGLVKDIKNYGQVLQLVGVVALIIWFAYLGVKFNSYKLTKQGAPYPLDSRLVGQYLKNNYTSLPVYYYSTIGTKPSIVFYSDRIVNFLRYPSPKPVERFILISEVAPGFENSELVFSTSTQKVYEVK